MGRCVGVRGVWEVGCWGCTHMAERVAAISREAAPVLSHQKCMHAVTDAEAGCNRSFKASKGVVSRL